MREPSDGLDGAVWRRGASLGLILAAVFFGVTAGVYGLMGLVGWSGTARALCAMGIGPALASGAILAWVVIWRPALAPVEGGSADRPTDPSPTQLSRRTLPLRPDASEEPEELT